MKDRKYKIVTAPRRNSRHWKAGTVTWGELLEWVKAPASRKEAGSYLLGTLAETTVDHDNAPGCTALHRLKNAVTSRSEVLVLDADALTPAGLEDLKEELRKYKSILHTTYSHTPDAPHVRILLAVDREMHPDEYQGAVSVMMDRLGREYFDLGSLQAERYMFRPAAKDLDSYEYHVFDGAEASVDDLLQEFDPTALPAPMRRKSKRSPFELEGVVGAFNRAYPDLEELVAEYGLPYERVGENRWLLSGASSAPGMGPVAEGVFYSHHANDPAGGQACTAFDVVRLHMYHHLDADVKDGTPINRHPSYEAMRELAAKDPRVIAELVGGDFTALTDSEADGDAGPEADDSWRLNLSISPRTGKLNDTVDNWDLIRANDPVFRSLYYNEMTFAVEADRDLPWRRLADGGERLSNSDRAEMAFYIERTYRFRPTRAMLDDLIAAQGASRRVHPVRQYLEGLVWDGKPRVETSLPGVTPTDYTRLVARKVLTAAVARVFEPGIKWDHTLVLYGTEGLGKSYWVERLSRGWHSSLGRLGDKDTLINLQRSWIVLADEGFSLRKADAEVQKEFLTRTVDVFRMPYEREASAHPRHCVIWGTTNDEVFLRQQEGNRRYLIVHCERRVDFEALTDEYIDQLWAEAVHLYRNGERLYLASEESEVAASVRERFTEEDALGGFISDFLDTLVPEEWEEMSPSARIRWMRDRADGMVPEGTRLQTQTCSAQIWVEAMGNRFGDHKRTDLLEITAALKRLPGWRSVGRRRIPHYGPQVVFERMDGWELL